MIILQTRQDSVARALLETTWASVFDERECLSTSHAPECTYLGI